MFTFNVRGLVAWSRGAVVRVVSVVAVVRRRVGPQRKSFVTEDI